MLSTETVAEPPEASRIPLTTLANILVIEDEDLIRETLVLALEEEGYHTLVASDGYEALSLMNNYLLTDSFPKDAEIHLIILDVMLPGINGLDLCRIIRGEGCTVPILMISAKGSEIDRVVGLEIGADDYLAKPFGMREMLARCRALLRRTQIQPSTALTVLRFRDLCLYPQECRVTLRGKEINLSPKEYKLLELFMRHPRRVWPREQLLDQVWGPDFIGDSKTVDVHIRWLREKIETDPSHPQYILTVRGFGYRFG
ncbi:inorganic phosphate-responsive two component signal transduction system response regulator of phosphate metabolism SphR [Thermosynechococcus sp. NK55a]|uniref:winged helix-turn-helix domain-containing protein n=1 Tax=Thermosynechococcus sp. NK55a TaxID=1394889 RepID=UPI0003D8AA53|nr:response regulator transcription factor [Thermosynechococcus sp. NK55a]AHB89613.1 inorganic phosphate-responsive two component signal transduction system response regulator of phosphate metabolism SphR [Thermosynechococcus sp. NK55a]